MKVLFSKDFWKGYQKADRFVQGRFDQVLRIFSEDPFAPGLRNHKLSGHLKHCRSINITGDYRVIFRELSEGRYELVELLEIGTHAQIYG